MQILVWKSCPLNNSETLGDVFVKLGTEQNRTELYSIEIMLRPHAGGIREHVVIYLTATM